MRNGGLLTFLLVLQLRTAYQAGIFSWIMNNINYSSDGFRLDGSEPIDATNFYEFPSQCAARCYTNSHCEAFNFHKGLKICELLGSNDQQPGVSLIPAEGFTYFRLETWVINPSALGPCGFRPCQEEEFCINKGSCGIDDAAYCECKDGWDGDDCSVSVGVYSFDTWSDWSACSTTCGYGQKIRTRTCSRGSEAAEDRLCNGSPRETVNCDTSRPCPEWGNWTDWEACSTLNTCGPGSTSRTRSCLHGGVVGADKKCMGLPTQTELCQLPSCNTALKLEQKADFAEGSLKVPRDDGAEGFICADDWDVTDASVACRQLGFKAAAEATQYEPEGSHFVLTAFNCDGSEITLVSCLHGGWQEEETCPSEKIAGVKCIVDGQWSAWGEWGECSVTCADGIQLRQRNCTDPPPKNGGENCPDADTDYKNCTLPPCPVDGQWASWSGWQTCSVTCGGGTQSRERNCNAPQHDGEWCVGSATDTQGCNDDECPVDGYWETWTSWGDCSKSCGGGAQNRTRTCNQPKYNGEPCAGSDYETADCNTHSCPIDGTWTEWSDWAVCNATCGGGHTVRNRECTGVLFGGKTCPGTHQEREQCNIQSCAVDGVWNEWSDWSECSTTCENGTQTRARTCNGPLHGGANCSGDWTGEKECFLRMCPIDGQFDEWSPWGECSVTCADGIKLRNRTCIGPFYGGAPCMGQLEDSDGCNPGPCPVDGEWEGWLSWSACSVSCGRGDRGRTRSCKQPQHGGFTCPGQGDQIEECVKGTCAVNGKWKAWAEWSQCTRSCDNGTRTRHRGCNGPYNDGFNCSGDWAQSEDCGIRPCPEDGIWEQWSSWGGCSKTCWPGGLKTRTRTCAGPFYGGQNCTGEYEDNVTCNVFQCPVNGEWLNWSAWSECTVSCGGGEKERNRTCYGAAHGGDTCPGGDGFTQNQLFVCNEHNCPIDGVWANWGAWGECSESCGDGSKIRTRACDGPYYEGKDCTGDNTDTDSCFVIHCPIDGYWHPWGDWEECSVTCGGGLKNRTRDCEPSQFGGEDCQGLSWDETNCGTNECPIDCKWDDWAAWRECSVSCGGGTQDRSRGIRVTDQFGGQRCQGSADDTQDCNSNHCPIDGVLLEWSEWSQCTTTCGEGSSTRTRECKPPQYGGNTCEGSLNDNRACNEAPCALPGLWTEWSDWGDCSATSGGGTRLKTRNCDRTQGLNTLDCDGNENTKTETCNDFIANPLPIACEYAVEMGLVNSDYIQVDPTGSYPFWAWCDVHTGETVVHHKSENETHVQGYEGAGEYQLDLEYVDRFGDTIPINEVIELVRASDKCKQFVSWECQSAVFNSPTEAGRINYVLTYPVNMAGQAMSYWGGAAYKNHEENLDTMSCACGDTGTCGDPGNPNPNIRCNCDMNDEVWRSDSGYIDFKLDLPLTGVRAGDTGSDGQRESGYHMIGPLLCAGKFDYESYYDFISGIFG